MTDEHSPRPLPPGLLRRGVVATAVALFGLWTALHLGQLTGTQNGVVRFGLTLMLAVLLLCRRRRSRFRPPGAAAAAAGVLGAVAAVAGVVFGVRQIEWIGLLAVLGACLAWGLPAGAAPDVGRALLLLYWAHPLPAQVFGPLQMAMQWLSVQGAERFLHWFNVRAWADGWVLRTVAGTYEVPAWCSGMRAAATVFLLALGLGMLRRLRAWEIAILTALALAQALALNVLRIAGMALLAPGLGSPTGVGFLHDTTGLLVLLGILLVYLETKAWHTARARRERAARELNPEIMTHVMTRITIPLRHLARHKWAAAGCLLLAVLAGLAVYRSRPAHRLAMLKDLTLQLRDGGRYDDAQRVGEAVRKLIPSDPQWRYILLRLMVIRGRYAAALARLDALPRSTALDKVRKSILEAYCLMGLGRLTEAEGIVRGLPELAVRKDPRVAMILAELARASGDPEAVSEHVLTAAQWLPNTERIRKLYPYLRAHRRWEAIADSDRDLPYRESAYALPVLEAHMNRDDVPQVAAMVLRGMRAWPSDPRLLEPLFFLAVREGEGKWQIHFAQHLARTLSAVADPDALYELTDKCFELARPDLAWAALRRLEQVDPGHPAVPLSAARHGREWFSFRRRRLGMTTPFIDDRIDVTPYYLLSRLWPSFSPLRELVPYGSELASSDRVAVRRRFLDRALEAFEHRQREGRLSTAMQYEYVRALDLAGDLDAARRQLDRMLSEDPSQEQRVLETLSLLYEHRGDWQQVYEALYRVPFGPRPRLGALRRLCRAQLELRLELAAWHTALEAVRCYPNSAGATATLAEVLLRLGAPEEALFVAENQTVRKTRELKKTEARALHETRRYLACRRFCQAHQLALIPLPERPVQPLYLPPAELSVLWHRTHAPSEEHFRAHADALKRNLAAGVESPFLGELMGLWLECHAARALGPSAESRRWLACGRTPAEQATALSQLALLLAEHRRAGAALSVAVEAARRLPALPGLWRMAIGLSNADPGLIREARRACPEDPEIWLAELVTRTQPHGFGRIDWRRNRYRRALDRAVGVDPELADWALARVERAAAARVYPAGAMTRAAEYLLAVGLPRAACRAAGDAAARARGLLPSYVVDLKCALRLRDRDRARAATRLAIRHALRPPALFYERLVRLKAGQEPIEIDDDMVVALREMRRRDPDNPLWPQILGLVLFRRGGWETTDALYEMKAAIANGATNRTSYVLGAEAARRLGRTREAAALLQTGLELYPGDSVLLNNLAYTLARTPETASLAAPLIEPLESLAGSHPGMQDTLALLYLRAGRTNAAERTAAELRRKAEPGSPPWFHAGLYRAEIALARGAPARAAEILKETLARSREVDTDDVLEATRLQARVEEAADREALEAKP